MVSIERVQDEMLAAFARGMEKRLQKRGKMLINASALCNLFGSSYGKQQLQLCGLRSLLNLAREW